MSIRIETTFRKTKPFHLTFVNVFASDLPRSLQGYRIVQLTDLHYGPCTPQWIIEKAVSLANEQDPSLVVITGDFLQVSRAGVEHQVATKVSPKLAGWTKYRRKTRKLTQELLPLLSPLRAPDGIFASPGNHDYYDGLSTLKRLSKEQFTWLTNDSIKITRDDGSLCLAAVDDVLQGKPNLPKALESAHQSELCILLSHNPDIVLDEEHHHLSKANLVLCGHTHGGQICLPGYGAILTRTKQRKHVSGLSFYGDTAIYVSRGIGNSLINFRLFCPPEIVVITLH